MQDPNFGLEEIKEEVSNIEANLTSPNFGLEEIKQEVSSTEQKVSSIKQNMKIGATKSLSIPVPADSTFVIGAWRYYHCCYYAQSFRSTRDSNIKICVDATSLAGNQNNMITLKLDVAGDGDFAIHPEVKGAMGGDPGGSGGAGSTSCVPSSTLANVNCFEVAASEFQLVIVNDEADPRDVEVAIIWNTAERILSP